jgi:hypothetical protein
MLRNVFTKECLEIGVTRLTDGTIRLNIGSDFSASSRKSELYVNERKLSENVETFWKGIKTKKLQKLQLSFTEIDWYDDEVAPYETPIFSIGRGLKKAKITHRTHGSVPKDWGVDLNCIIADTTTNTPIMEIVKSALGSLLTSDLEKEFIKELKPFLQKKVTRTCSQVEMEY